MGTWGTALFSDDTASDVREDFRTYIGNGLSPEAATAAMLAEWASTIEDVDEGPTFWLALASTQWMLGRLVPSVLTEAMRVLDSGGDLSRWTHDAKLVAKRRAVLVKLRAQLNSQQPAARAIPRKFRNSNDWAVGSIRAYKLKTGDLCLLRVIGHHTDRGGTSPIAEVLDWVGGSFPDKAEIEKMKIRRYQYPNGREISQFLLGATSEREIKAARVSDTGIVSRPAQKPGGYSVFLWRNFDRDLAKYFAFGVSKT